MAASSEHLELWLDRLATKLRTNNDVTVDIVAGDKLLGSTITLVIMIGGRHAEIVAVRSKQRRSHVAVFADGEPTARRLAEMLEPAYRAIGRIANSERKLIHRIERVARTLVGGWENQMRAFPEDARVKAATAFEGEVRPMLGRGYHVEIGGADEDSERHRYDPFDAISVPIGSRRRALVWDRHVRQFFVSPSLRGEIDPTKAAAAGIALFAGAALAAEVADEVVQQNQPQRDNIVVDTAGDVLEATTEAVCQMPEILSSISNCAPDIGSCVPDCGSFDVPDCDIGGCDL